MSKKKAAAKEAKPGEPPKIDDTQIVGTAEISHEEASELAGVAVDDILAVNDHGDSYHVITKDGQKHKVEK